MKFNPRLCLITSAVFLTLSSSNLIAQDKPLTASIAAISATAGYDKDDEDTKELFYHSSQPEVKYTFLVKAKNIVQIMEDTLVVEGDKSWECGMFNKTSENSNASTFSILKKDASMNLSELKFKGSIDIQTGKELVKKDFTLEAFDKPVTVDAFTFMMKKGSLNVTGDYALIKEIKITLNGNEMKTMGSNWSGKNKTYNFDGIDTGAKVSLSYWSGLNTKKVQFSN